MLDADKIKDSQIWTVREISEMYPDMPGPMMPPRPRPALRMPAGDIADPGCAVAVMHRSEYRPQPDQTACALALQADALARADQAEDALAAEMQVDDLGSIRRRGKLGDQDIADIGAGILMRDQEPLTFEVGPVDKRPFGQWMILRDGYHQMFGADWHGVEHRTAIWIT